MLHRGHVQSNPVPRSAAALLGVGSVGLSNCPRIARLCHSRRVRAVSSARDVERPILFEARRRAGRERRDAPGGCHLKLGGDDELRLSQWRQVHGSYASSLYTIGVASLWNGHRYGLFKFRDGDARHLPCAMTCAHQAWQGESM